MMAELEAMYLRLPLRNPRPMLATDDATPEPAALEADTSELVEASERERTARCMAAAVDGVLETFDAEDRAILRMRFWQSRKMRDIARLLQIEPKKIYKRLDKFFATLRAALERAGIDRRDIDTLVARGDQEIRFDFLHAKGNRLDGPSHRGDGEVADRDDGRMR